MSLWDEAAAQKAMDNADNELSLRAERAEAKRQSMQLREFVKAMTTLRVSTVRCGFWRNIGGPRSKGTRKLRSLGTVDAWVIYEKPGNFYSWPEKFFVTADCLVYSAAQIKAQQSSTTSPEPVKLPIHATFGGTDTLGDRLRSASPATCPRTNIARTWWCPQ